MLGALTTESLVLLLQNLDLGLSFLGFISLILEVLLTLLDVLLEQIFPLLGSVESGRENMALPASYDFRISILVGVLHILSKLHLLGLVLKLLIPLLWPTWC